MAGGGWCAVSLCNVKYGETEAKGCLTGTKSDTLIRMVALADGDFGAGPGQSRTLHSSLILFQAQLIFSHVKSSKYQCMYFDLFYADHPKMNCDSKQF